MDYKKINISKKECIFKDKNNKKLLNGLLFGSCIDYWHIFHFLLYVIIGLLMPNKHLLIFFLSFFWETFEHISFKYILNKCNSLICGRVEDIFLNIIGYTIGSYLTSIY
jgi:hypothetical protein